nr:reverse transcriptase domain-containing protein [Tanacetum cinerariifolium]
MKVKRDMSKYCHFHKDYRHDTNDCRHLRTQIQEAVNLGQLSHLVKGIKKERTRSSDTPRGEIKKDKGTALAEEPILMVRRTMMQRMGIIVSMIHEAIKFHTKKGIGTVLLAGETSEGTKRAKKIFSTNEERILSCVNVEEKIIINDMYLDQTVTIRKQLPEHFKKELKNLLKSNADVFSWTHADMTGILRTILVERKLFNTEHKLNEYNHIKQIKQNKRGLGPYRNMAACKEIEELTKAGPFLGHLITKHGIKANPSKVKAVINLDQPRTLKDIQSLNGKLAALSQFLSKGTERSLAFFKALKGNEKEMPADFLVEIPLEDNDKKEKPRCQIKAVNEDATLTEPPTQMDQEHG